MLEADEEKQLELKESLLSDLLKEGIDAAAKEGVAEHLSARLAERQVRDMLLSQMPKRDDLIAAASTTIQINGQSTYSAELARYKAMLRAKDLQGIIARYPVRHSGILNAIAKALKFQGRTVYETAAVARVSSDEILRAKLLVKLDPLSSVINA